MDGFRQQVELAREVLPHENPQLLEMLLFRYEYKIIIVPQHYYFSVFVITQHTHTPNTNRGLVLDEIVELLLILPPEQKMMLMLGDQYGNNNNKESGRNEEELRRKKKEETIAEIAFQPTDMDEQLLYNASWKVGKKTKKTSAHAGGGVIQGDLDSDSDDSGEDTSEMMDLYSNYNDQWIEPQGDLAHWYSRGRFYKDAADVAPEKPKSPEKQPPPYPKTDEIQLWAHDWEEQSDDDELLTAKERLVEYSGIFEKGGYMEVGRELRRDRKTFEREKKEVLKRVAKTIKQQVEYHPSTEPAKGDIQDGFGVDDTTVTLLEPRRSYSSFSCCKCLCFLDSPIRFSDVNIPTKNATWILPKNKNKAMSLHVKNAHLAIHPFHWRWRALEMCCCGIGPWACLDSGTTSLSTHLDLFIDFHTNLHPSPPPDLPVVKINSVKVKFRDITPTTTESQGCCSCEPPKLDKDCMFFFLFFCFFFIMLKTTSCIDKKHKNSSNDKRLEDTTQKLGSERMVNCPTNLLFELYPWNVRMLFFIDC